MCGESRDIQMIRLRPAPLFLALRPERGSYLEIYPNPFVEKLLNDDHYHHHIKSQDYYHNSIFDHDEPLETTDVTVFRKDEEIVQRYSQQLGNHPSSANKKQDMGSAPLRYYLC